MNLAKTFAVLSVSAFALVACTDMDGTPNQAVTGAVIGGVTGVALGNVFGGTKESRLIGGVIGTIAGTAIGDQLDSQERDLRAAMAGTSAGITNTGNSLIVVLPEAITFNTGSAVVHSSLVPSIYQVAASLRRYPNTHVQIVGHTDNVGSAAYNQDLSERRALAVTRFLIAGGAPSQRMQVFGQSFNMPIASNATAAGRAANRRVEIIIIPN